jgi:hypothetical protein
MATKKQQIWNLLMEEGADAYSGRELADKFDTSKQYALNWFQTDPLWV